MNAFVKSSCVTFLLTALVVSCSHSYKNRSKNQNHVVLQINNFLANEKEQLGLFENNRILESIELRSKRNSMDLVYRVTSNQCAVEVIVAENQQHEVRNFNCDGKNPEASLKASLHFSKNVSEFKKHLFNAYEYQLLKDEEIVMAALDVLEAEQKSIKTAHRKKKLMLIKLDAVLNQLFAQINSLNKRVKNGVMPDDKYLHYKLESFSHETVSRYKTLANKLKL